jgi:hypothetical protein
MAGKSLLFEAESAENQPLIAVDSRVVDVGARKRLAGSRRGDDWWEEGTR